MFIDYRELDQGKQIDADICIIGAGPAGITIARAFIDSPAQLCLLESGGFNFDERIDSLNELEAVGYFRPSFQTRCRMRYFGGSSNLWVGMCEPLEDIDFQVRPWVRHSGWPIRKIDLDSYYKAAHPLLEIGAYRYDIASLANKNLGALLAFQPEKLVIGSHRYSPPTRFGSTYRKELTEARNVRVFLNANVTHLEPNETASAVRTARLRTLGGKEGSVRAKFFVLACGGIENARILLLSNGVQGEGLGNRHDLVGRFFMQHPNPPGSIGTIHARDPNALADQFQIYEGRGVPVQANIYPAVEAQRHHKILNYFCQIGTDSEDAATGYTELRSIIKSLGERRWPEDLGDKLWTVITDFDEVAKGLAGRAKGKHYQAPVVNSLGLTIRSEQAPNPDSRLTLSEQKDSLGLNKIKIDWKLSDIDTRTIQVGGELIGQELGRLGLGRLQLAEWIAAKDVAWSPTLFGGCHHMGTTRMADSPKQGVVDRDCRVHSLANLYIAGSSVFPTGGAAPPTLTIVALALRLVDHLKGRLA